jgi:2-polyprenyl-6-methoxyphenol hydroxylase-like FAD-dependent oxidoreductase
MADISHMIRIAAPIDRVAALAGTADGFTKWWAEDVTAAPDGGVTLGFFNRETIYALRPLEKSAQRIAWRCETGQEWSGTDIRFELAQDKSATVLRFTHANWRAVTDFFTSCNTTWGELMFRLAGEAEGHGRGPLFKRDGLGY